MSKSSYIDILTRVSQYRMFRKDTGEGGLDSIILQVFSGVDSGTTMSAGERRGKYSATPTRDWGMFYEAEPQYIGVGETEDEAIKDCMERIKDVPFAEIFNDLKK